MIKIQKPKVPIIDANLITQRNRAKLKTDPTWKKKHFIVLVNNVRSLKVNRKTTHFQRRIYLDILVITETWKYSAEEEEKLKLTKKT